MQAGSSSSRLCGWSAGQLAARSGVVRQTCWAEWKEAGAVLSAEGSAAPAAAPVPPLSLLRSVMGAACSCLCCSASTLCTAAPAAHQSLLRPCGAGLPGLTSLASHLVWTDCTWARASWTQKKRLTSRAADQPPASSLGRLPRSQEKPTPGAGQGRCSSQALPTARPGTQTLCSWPGLHRPPLTWRPQRRRQSARAQSCSRAGAGFGLLHLPLARVQNSVPRACSGLWV